MRFNHFMESVVAFGVSLLPMPHSLPAQSKFALEAQPRVKVTVVVDNLAGEGSVLGEWGASFLIQTDASQILYDTGAGSTVLGNARALGLNLGKTDAIVLSHEHGDHTGGLNAVLGNFGSLDLFVHPAGFTVRYWKDGTMAQPHSLPIARKTAGGKVRKIIETKKPTAVAKGVMVTGEIPRVNDYEDTGVREYAFLDEAMTKPDPILDDQAVFFRAPEGLVVILGCGHAGIVNTMEYVTKITSERRIYAIIGGTHLLTASSARIRKTIEALREFDVKKVMFSHCTGVQAFAEIAAALPGRCSWPGSGTVIRFGE
jgi:7,8-dihydropterin-6-yl-methyl-4-(beta-D-ribofuranosyl)aminobenzene 5'-phosphate synthase